LTGLDFLVVFLSINGNGFPSGNSAIFQSQTVRVLQRGISKMLHIIPLHEISIDDPFLSHKYLTVEKRCDSMIIMAILNIPLAKHRPGTSNLWRYF
jgi:hypothetical protein